MVEKALMAVGAHADDIELNSGGTLSKYYSRGYEIVYVMATNNMSGGWSWLNADGEKESRKPPYYEIMPQRKREAAAAAALFGTEPIHLDHPQRHYTREDGTVSHLTFGSDRPDCIPPDTHTIATAYEDAQAVDNLSNLILKHNPEAILTHNHAAANVEHFGTCLLVIKAYWKAVDAGYDGMLLLWPELGITIYGRESLKWNSFVDVTGFWDRKLEAIGKHACQMPDPSRLDLPAWGAACGCEKAEVFTVLAYNEQVPQQQDFSMEVLNHLRS